jgi:hypothetical protein
MTFKLTWRFSNSDNSKNNSHFDSKKQRNKQIDEKLIQWSRRLSCQIHIDGNCSKNWSFSRNIVSMSSDRFSFFLTQLYYPKDFSASLNWILTHKQICKVWYLQKKMYLEVESPTLEKNRITYSGCFTL